MSFAGFYPPKSDVKTVDGLDHFYRTLEVVGQDVDAGSGTIKEPILASYHDEDGNLIHIEPQEQFDDVIEKLKSHGFKVKPPQTEFQLTNFTKEQIAIASSVFEVEKI